MLHVSFVRTNPSFGMPSPKDRMYEALDLCSSADFSRHCGGAWSFLRRRSLARSNDFQVKDTKRHLWRRFLRPEVSSRCVGIIDSIVGSNITARKALGPLSKVGNNGRE